MIRLKRNRSPKHIHPSLVGERLLERLHRLCAARIAQGEAMTWSGVLTDWKKMKRFLVRDSQGKCAYCESHTASVAHGDVEHFRPRSAYWWLALCVDNHVYACQLCNQLYKRGHFPVQGKRMREPRLPAVMPNGAGMRWRLLRRVSPDPLAMDDAQILAAWSRERADLPHPYLEDPEPLFAWAAVETNEEVHLVPPARASARSRRAVTAAVTCLGLNRETLSRMRYKVFVALRLAVNVWRQGAPHQRDDALTYVLRMCASDQPFAGMCRYFAREAGALPPLNNSA